MKKNRFGLVRVAVAVPHVRVANPHKNAKELIDLCHQAVRQGVDVLTFPELCLTGYTCGDLFTQSFLLQEAMSALSHFLIATKSMETIVQIGMPLVVNDQLFNVAVTCFNGTILSIVPKSYIPNYKHFFEGRWFRPADQASVNEITLLNQRVPFGTDILIDVIIGDHWCTKPLFTLGTEICEDVWMEIPPSSHQAIAGATILTNLSASNSEIGKREYRTQLISNQSARCMAAYLYASCGPHESSADVIFDGDAMIVENGTVRARTKPFSFDTQLLIADVDVERLQRERLLSGSASQARALERNAFRRVTCELNTVREQMWTAPMITLNKTPFVPSNDAERAARCESIYDHVVTALARRLMHLDSVTKSRTVTIGVSGGLDSLLAFLFTLRVFDLLDWNRKDIVAVTMPGPGTSDRTLKNARCLLQLTGVTYKQLPIEDLVTRRLRLLGHEPCWNCLMCENAQARERTDILMNLGFVIGTGDLSEIAQGWCTYNADVQSMYNPNGDIPKTLVRHLVLHAADANLFPEITPVIRDVYATPVSPELIKAKEPGQIEQKTEDLIGPYILHDFFLWHMIRNGFSPQKIARLARLTFEQEFGTQTILLWLNKFLVRFSNAQFKRQNLPDCPKIASVSLHGRGDWRAPSDVVLDAWIHEAQDLLVDP